MPDLPTPATWGRAVFSAAEPFALFGLVNAGVRDSLKAAGLPGRSVYPVVRSAPMGAAHPAVVIAAFRSLPPLAMIAALPAAWDVVTPDQAVAASHAAVTDACRALPEGAPAEDRVRQVAGLLARAVAAAETTGRPLGAANAAVPAPEDPWAAVWRSLTALRELRGDGHIAALVAADLDLVETEVLMVGWAADRIDVPMLRETRRLDDAAWASGVERLVTRGLVTPDAALTPAGRELREEIERQTDAAAAAAWRALGQEESAEVWSCARDLSAAFVAAGWARTVTPVGAAWPSLHPGQQPG